MALAIAFTISNSTLLHKFSNRGLKNSGDLFLFNAGMNAVWVLVIGIWSLFSGGLHFDSTTILFGVIYAFILCLFSFFKLMSYSSGPVSLTTLIASCSFLITTAYSYFFEKQNISFSALIGIFVLLISLVLCIDPKASYGEVGGKIGLKWIIYTLIFFLAGGGVGILYREFGKSPAHDNINTMMFIAAGALAIGFFILSFCINGVAKNPKPRLTGYAVKFMLICGLTSCIYIRLNIFLASVIPSIIFFPVSNGSCVLAAAVIGWILFKERLNGKQIFGVALGIVGMVIIGVYK